MESASPAESIMNETNLYFYFRVVHLSIQDSWALLISKSLLAELFMFRYKVDIEIMAANRVFSSKRMREGSLHKIK